jgi:hypothetical protein
MPIACAKLSRSLSRSFVEGERRVEVRKVRLAGLGHVSHRADCARRRAQAVASSAP